MLVHLKLVTWKLKTVIFLLQIDLNEFSKISLTQTSSHRRRAFSALQKAKFWNTEKMLLIKLKTKHRAKIKTNNRSRSSNFRKLWNSCPRKRQLFSTENRLLLYKTPSGRNRTAREPVQNFLLNSLVKRPKVGVTSADATTTIRPTGNPRLISG